MPILLLLLGLLLSRVAVCQASQVGLLLAHRQWVIEQHLRDRHRRAGEGDRVCRVSGGQCVGCHNVSPQGARIAAIAGGGAGPVVVYDLAGTRIEAPSLNGSYVALSPDGRRLAVSDTNSDIQIVGFATGVVQPLEGASDPDVYEQMPAWSPDASEIVFVRGTVFREPLDLRGSV